jgi:hypothetical protein
MFALLREMGGFCSADQAMGLNWPSDSSRISKKLAGQGRKFSNAIFDKR